MRPESKNRVRIRICRGVLGLALALPLSSEARLPPDLDRSLFNAQELEFLEQAFEPNLSHRLGLAAGATPEMVRKAFRQRQMVLYPKDLQTLNQPERVKWLNEAVMNLQTAYQSLSQGNVSSGGGGSASAAAASEKMRAGPYFNDIHFRKHIYSSYLNHPGLTPERRYEGILRELSEWTRITGESWKLSDCLDGLYRGAVMGSRWEPFFEIPESSKKAVTAAIVELASRDPDMTSYGLLKRIAEDAFAVRNYRIRDQAIAAIRKTEPTLAEQLEQQNKGFRDHCVSAFSGISRSFRWGSMAAGASLLHPADAEAKSGPSTLELDCNDPPESPQ